MKKYFIVLIILSNVQQFTFSRTYNHSQKQPIISRYKLGNLKTTFKFKNNSLKLQKKILTKAIPPNSELDPTFGFNGLVAADIATILGTSSRDIINSIAIQTDGKIIAAGESACIKNRYNYALARYTTQGKLDETFGFNGVVLTDVGILLGKAPNTTYSYANGVLIQPDGKIVAGGNIQIGSLVFACLVRYKTDGSVDTDFGNAGAVMTNVGAIFGSPGTNSQINDIILQPDGKILASGISEINSPNGTLALIRYNTDGSLDTTFGTDNSGVTVAPEFVGSINVALQSDGKIIVGGANNNSSTGMFAITRYDPNGAIDNTFGTNGIVTTNFGPGSFASSTAIDSSDNIIAGGVFNDSSDTAHYIMAKYDSNGNLDNSFGTLGTIDIVLPNQIIISDLILQSDGKIVTVGPNIAQTTISSIVFALTRLKSNGTFDNTFGDNGIVLTNFGSPGYDDTSNAPFTLLIQSNGKIVAAGFSNAVDLNLDFVIARYTTNGTLDQTYGGVEVFGDTYKGLADTDFKTVLNIPGGGSNCANSVATLSNGIIALAGYADAIDPNYNFTFLFLNPNGTQSTQWLVQSIDFTTFAGPFNFIFGSYDILNSMVVQKDNKVIGAGFSDVIGNPFSFALTRINKNGKDLSFGSSGLVVTNFGQTQGKQTTSDIINSIALQTDGKIVAGGNTAPDNKNIVGSFALARYNTDGSLDNSFGTLNNGIVSTNIGNTLGSSTTSDSINSVALQSDGKILAGGVSTYQNLFGNFALARYDTNGTLDTSFGNKGIVITNFDSNKANASLINKVAIQPDGKILVGGITTVKMSNFDPNNLRYNFALARYETDGTLDKTFGNNGLVVTTINPQGNNSTSNDYLSTLVIQKNGSIIAGGTSNATDPNYDFTLVVYHSNGSVNTSVGNNGVIFTDFKTVVGLGANSQDSINQSAMAIQADGKVLAAGSTNATNSNFDFAIARYDIVSSNNNLDTFMQALCAKYG